MVRLIRIVADIDPASLVDAANRFAKTDDRKGGREGFGQSAFLPVYFPFRKMVGGRDFVLIQYNCACGNGRAHSKSFYHLFTSFCCFSGALQVSSATSSWWGIAGIFQDCFVLRTPAILPPIRNPRGPCPATSSWWGIAGIFQDCSVLRTPAILPPFGIRGGPTPLLPHGGV